MSAARPGGRFAASAARLGAVFAVVFAAAVAGAGCSRQGDEPPPAPPAVLSTAPGSALPVVTLSEAGFRAVRVQTVPVQAAAAGLVIPAKAVIFSPDGRAWTYAAVGPRAYLRKAIVIDHISGPDAVLSSGPAAGTPVVSIGAPELLGTEYGVGEE